MDPPDVHIYIRGHHTIVPASEGHFDGPANDPGSLPVIRPVPAHLLNGLCLVSSPRGQSVRKEPRKLAEQFIYLLFIYLPPQRRLLLRDTNDCRRRAGAGQHSGGAYQLVFHSGELYRAQPPPEKIASPADRSLHRQPKPPYRSRGERRQPGHWNLHAVAISSTLERREEDTSTHAPSVKSGSRRETRGG